MLLQRQKSHHKISKFRRRLGEVERRRIRDPLDLPHLLPSQCLNQLFDILDGVNASLNSAACIASQCEHVPALIVWYCVPLKLTQASSLHPTSCCHQQYPDETEVCLHTLQVLCIWWHMLCSCWFWFCVLWVVSGGSKRVEELGEDLRGRGSLNL